VLFLLVVGVVGAIIPLVVARDSEMWMQILLGI
jgi:hypothetical protein